MAERVRILFLLPHLGGGGAEQVTRLLVNGINESRYEIHLATVHSCSPDLARTVRPAAHLHACNAVRVRTATLKILATVWRLRPQLVFSSMAHLSFLVLLMKPLLPRATRILVRQNGTVSSLLASQKNPRITRLLYRHLYRRADSVICQSHAMKRDMESVIEGILPKTVVLDNPVEAQACRQDDTALPAWSGPGPHLIAIGRLSHEKGYDLLLRAFARLKVRHPSADIAIAGQGSEREPLLALCRNLGLLESVRFLGAVEAPASYFREAALFVLSSRHEGMPNALLEAAMAGLPIVATPASGGLTELLADQDGVWLADAVSEDALAAALFDALSHVDGKQRFAHHWATRFEPSRAIAAYESHFDQLLQAERP